MMRLKTHCLFLIGLSVSLFSLRAQTIPERMPVLFKLKWEQPAQKIALIASFNHFDKNADLLTGPDSAGIWRIEKKLPYGKYEYRFLIDDRIYLRDPANPVFGGVHSNSILYLDPPPQPHTELLSPQPGERVEKLPLTIQVKFFPGTQTDKPDTRKSLCQVDGRSLRLKYDRKVQVLWSRVHALPEGEHRLKVQIQDKKKNRARAVQTIFVVKDRNEPPVAEAGYTLFCRPNQPLRLNGGLSYDPDLDDIWQYQWVRLDSTTGLQFDAGQNTAFPKVRFSAAGDYRFSLRVSDGKQWSAPDTTTVYCRSFPETFAEFQLFAKQVPASRPLRSVSVAGEFNRWQPDRDFLQPTADSARWMLRKPLRPGQYEYKYVLNSTVWIPDPANPVQVEDGWQGVNSVLTVPPLFPEQLHWEFKLRRHSFALQNIPPYPFDLIPDNNNPEALSADADSLHLVYSKPGSYFLYALPDSAGQIRPPHTFLIENAGNGSMKLLDFHQPPGWARRAVVYQIYLRVFGPDSTKPGTLRDLIARLDYLNDLGVNCVWLMPIMESPTEHGYTPVNYFRIDPDYGTLKDFDQLVAELHRRGMKLFFDFIANHSSDQHRYFLSAWQNPKSVFRHWYRWQGRYHYEFHNDWDQLPNLNYDNPNVRHFILQVAKFWIDRGVDGLRCDAAWGVPHDFWKDFRRCVKNWNPQVVLLDEVLPRDPAFHDLEFDMSYDTDFYGNVLDVFRGKKSVEGLRFGLQKTRKNYPPQVVDFRYIENQDMERFIKQFGAEATRAAAVLLFTLPGMPLVYYGQEIGLTEMRGHMKWDSTGNALFYFYRKLIHLRTKKVAFSDRNVIFLNVNYPKKVLAFTRTNGADMFLVLINFSSQPLSIQADIPPGKTAYWVFGSRNPGPGIHWIDPHQVSLGAYGFLIAKFDSPLK